MTTDTSEKGLENLICEHLTGDTVVESDADGNLVGDRAAAFGAGWVTGKLDVREAAANLPDELGEDELLEPSGDLVRLEAAKIR